MLALKDGMSGFCEFMSNNEVACAVDLSCVNNKKRFIQITLHYV